MSSSCIIYMLMLCLFISLLFSFFRGAWRSRGRSKARRGSGKGRWLYGSGKNFCNSNLRSNGGQTFVVVMEEGFFVEVVRIACPRKWCHTPQTGALSTLNWLAWTELCEPACTNLAVFLCSQSRISVQARSHICLGRWGWMSWPYTSCCWPRST